MPVNKTFLNFITNSCLTALIQKRSSLVSVYLTLKVICLNSTLYHTKKAFQAQALAGNQLLRGQHYLYYFLLVYTIPHGRFYINTHPHRYTGLQSYKLTKMAVGILPHANSHALGSSGKHWLCVFLFIVLL